MADDKATRTVRGRYDRIASIYDFMEGFIERVSFRKWRALLWSKVEGGRILEVGVGTGKNLPYYPKSADMVAIDLSEKMLARARKKAAEDGVPAEFKQMDVQALDFADDSFDAVVESFVFCSVPDPVRGLIEVKRVCKPGGRVLLMEHMLSDNPVMAAMMNLANPITVRVGGENINRRTVDNVLKSGLIVERVTNLSAGVFKLIEARKPGQDIQRPQS